MSLVSIGSRALKGLNITLRMWFWGKKKRMVTTHTEKVVIIDFYERKKNTLLGSNGCHWQHQIKAAGLTASVIRTLMYAMKSLKVSKRGNKLQAKERTFSRTLTLWHWRNQVKVGPEASSRRVNRTEAVWMMSSPLKLIVLKSCCQPLHSHLMIFGFPETLLMPSFFCAKWKTIVNGGLLWSMASLAGTGKWLNGHPWPSADPGDVVILRAFRALTKEFFPPPFSSSSFMRTMTTYHTAVSCDVTCPPPTNQKGQTVRVVGLGR